MSDDHNFLSKVAPSARFLILDTSVLLHDPYAIERFKENVVIVGLWVIDELDDIAKSHDFGMARAAQSAIGVLSQYDKDDSDITNGVRMGSGWLVVDHDGDKMAWTGLLRGMKHSHNNQNIVLATEWQTEVKSLKYIGKKSRVAIITKDISLRIRANTCGIATEDYDYDKEIRNKEDLYTGKLHINVLPEDYCHICGGEHEGNIPIEAVRASLVKSKIKAETLLNNLCCILHNPGDKGEPIYGVYDANTRGIQPVPYVTDHHAIKPRGWEQRLADHFIWDMTNSVVALEGCAGTGKTILAVYAGFTLVRRKVFDRVVIFVPTAPVGFDLGFMPGNEGEKMSPFAMHIVETMASILRAEGIDNAREEAKKIILKGDEIEIRPVNFERGDSIHRTFIIVEEMQNFRPEEGRLIMTRPDAECKIVVNGDISQIDLKDRDYSNNALTYLIERMKGITFSDGRTFANITLTQTKRSPVAEKAAELL